MNYERVDEIERRAALGFPAEANDVLRLIRKLKHERALANERDTRLTHKDERKLREQRDQALDKVGTVKRGFVEKLQTILGLAEDRRHYDYLDVILQIEGIARKAVEA